MQSVPRLELLPRSLDARVDRGVRDASLASSSARTRAELRERAALGSAACGIAYLLTHMLLHALHVARCDSWQIPQLSPIPLFATVQAAAAISLPAGLLCFGLTRDPGAWLLRLPRLLIVLCALFVFETWVWP